MTAKIIDGKAVAQTVKDGLSKFIKQELARKSVIPNLKVVLVGENSASMQYVAAKAKAAEATGARSEVIRLPYETTQDELLSLIDVLNADDDVDAILVQFPLPKHIDDKEVLRRILSEKDADGLTPLSAGALALGMSNLVACTPHGIIKLIESTGEKIAGKRAVVIGRSNIVGKPMFHLLLARDATVTVCHSRTPNLAQEAKEADILIAAAGKADLVTADFVKPNSIVIDVGANRRPDGKLCGDVDFDAAKEIAGYISPVPGGVGPMTIAMLLYNTVKAACDRRGIKFDL